MGEVQRYWSREEFLDTIKENDIDTVTVHADLVLQRGDPLWPEHRFVAADDDTVHEYRRTLMNYAGDDGIGISATAAHKFAEHYRETYDQVSEIADLEVYSGYREVTT